MTGTDLVEYEPRNWVALMAPAVELARHVSDTAFVPKGLRGNAPAIVAAIMYGDEVGLGPMQALAKIAVIDGRPSLSAEAQRALILAAGHDIWVVESTNTKVTVAGRRTGSEHTSTITWTLDDAKRAGLVGRQNWRSYPRQMLMARATAELARLIFADAVGGLLATEELEDGDVESDGAEAPTSKRKRRSTAQPETTLRPAAETNGTERALPPLPGEPLIDEPGTEPSPTAALAAEGAGGSGTEPAPSVPDDSGALPTPHPGDAPAPEEKPLTLYRSKKAMDAIVGQLREAGKIKTEHLWSAVATDRGVGVTEMIELLGGYDEAGVLHWGPLRDSLELKEARELHSRLARLWINVQVETPA